MSNRVVVDLEMCRVPKMIKKDTFHYGYELIQIGAVVVDDDLQITDEFMTYVSPEYGKIDPFIENLTGISQRDVQGAPNFAEALGMFMDWLPDDSILVSWSESDEYQIRKETEAKGLVIEGLNGYFDNWIDCQKTFGKKMNAPKNYKLSEALIIADIDYDENEHDALVDARNTARLFVKMEQEPELVLNSYYSDKIEVAHYNPFEMLLANYCLA